MTGTASPHPSAGILGVGHALPVRVETNEELCRSLPDTTPEWIVEKTGITARRLAGEGETAWSMSVEAARGALQMAGVDPADLGLIVCCTFSGDLIFPPVSARVAAELGAKRAQTFDIQANCTGFVTGMTTAADRLNADEETKYALVIGVERHTRFIDRTDVETAVYFSDGAGAAVLGLVEDGAGLKASAFYTDPANFESVRLDSTDAYIVQNGLATWRQAITHLPTTLKRACAKAGVEPGEVDLVVFHQANLNMIRYLMRKMRLPEDATFTNVQEIGNTGAASVGIALSQAVQEGRVEPGDTVVLAAVGAGFTFGASVWTWA